MLAVLGLVGLGAGAVGGLWLLAVAAFLYVAGDAEAQSVRLERALGGRRAVDVARPPVCVPASVTAHEAIERAFAVHPFTSFPVVDDEGVALGLLTLDRLRTVPFDVRRLQTAGELADRDPDLVAEPRTRVVELLARPGFARVGRAIVVDAGGRPVGLLSRTDVARILRVGDLLGDPLPHSPRSVVPR